MTLESEIKSLEKELEIESASDNSPWRLVRLDEKIQHRKSLIDALAKDDGKWTKHTDTYWSRYVNGKRLDFWPSTKKFRINDKTYYGTPFNFISKQSTKDSYKTKIKAADEWEKNLVNQPEV